MPCNTSTGRTRWPCEFATPPGYLTQASLRQQLARQQVISSEERQKADRGELGFWEYDELGYIIAGTPERVEQRVRELATELRIGQLITCMHVGNLPEEVAAQNNHLFATGVIPKLREHLVRVEDRWTPMSARNASLNDSPCRSRPDLPSSRVLVDGCHTSSSTHSSCSTR